jgi:hypothetical protein
MSVKGRVKAANTSKVPKGSPKTPKSVRKTREDLAVESFVSQNLMFRDFGVTPAEQARAYKRALKLKSPPKISGPILRDWAGLSGMLLEWSRDALYLDADGKPRILPIRGPGTSFESLAQRFLPNIPLERVVAMACEAAEVATRSDDRIALLGSIMVNIVGSAERSFAHTVRQVDQLIQTKLYNRRMHKKGSPEGRMERMVIGTIPRAQFPELMRELRPQIYDLLLRADSSFERRQPDSLSDLRKATTVCVGLYVAQEDDFERAGFDAETRIKDARRSRKT